MNATDSKISDLVNESPKYASIIGIKIENPKIIKNLFKLLSLRLIKSAINNNDKSGLTSSMLENIIRTKKKMYKKAFKVLMPYFLSIHRMI